jgi:hypothetical protein
MRANQVDFENAFQFEFELWLIYYNIFDMQMSLIWLRLRNVNEVALEKCDT